MMLCFPHPPCLAALVTTGVLFVFNLAVVGSTHADEPLPGGHYRLLAVKVVPIERTQKAGVTNDHESDRLTHWVRFDIHPKFEWLKGTKHLPFKLLNPAITAKSELTLDKPIRFKGMELPAGFNLPRTRMGCSLRTQSVAPQKTRGNTSQARRMQGASVSIYRITLNANGPAT